MENSAGQGERVGKTRRGREREKMGMALPRAPTPFGVGLGITRPAIFKARQPQRPETEQPENKAALLSSPR